MKVVLHLLFVVVCVQGVKLPDSFKKCEKSKPEFKQCIRDAAEYNLRLMVRPYREVQLPGLKPFHLPTLIIGSGKRAVAVEQRFSTCELYGFHQAIFRVLEFDFEKKCILLDVVFREITKKCHYQLNGKVLLLPIQGEGASTLILKNMSLIGPMEYEEVVKNGKTYMHFTKNSLKLTADHVSFQFDNLFNGDKALGETINKMLNDNWRDVFDDVNDGYAQALNILLQGLFNQFWSKVSIEEAFN